ncbi:MAG: alkaline phytoceramidase [Betaproteobacteria bacterium]
MLARKAGIWSLAVLALAVTLAAVALPPLPQPPEYHQFADQRMLLGIPNFCNVSSNVAFALVGGAGIVSLLRNRSNRSRPLLDQSNRWPYLVLFAAVALTCIGSAYYHLAPDNLRLAWDRLPMSVGFMALLAAMIAERIDPKAGMALLGPLILLGVASVGYWRWGEAAGTGNLWPYVAVQVFAIVAVVLIIILFPPRYSRGTDILVAVAIYALAKGAEVYDREIFSIGRLVGGHALKHLFAALAIFWILRMIWKRADA